MMTLIIILTFILGIVISAFIDDWEFLSIAFFFIFIEIVITGVLLGCVVNGRVINDKIKMYEEQNTDIEIKVAETVKEYMKFEKETFTELKTDSSYITLVTLYPELNSNELIKKQINIYVSNNEKIKELKESKINVSNYKWWVYFGK